MYFHTKLCTVVELHNPHLLILRYGAHDTTSYSMPISNACSKLLAYRAI